MKKWLQIMLAMLAVFIVAGLIFGVSNIYSTNVRNARREAVDAEREVFADKQEEISDQHDRLDTISTSVTLLHEEYYEGAAGNLRNKSRNREFVERAATLIGQLNVLEVDGSLEQLRASIDKRVRADMKFWAVLAVKEDGPSDADTITYLTTHREAEATEEELRSSKPVLGWLDRLKKSGKE